MIKRILLVGILGSLFSSVGSSQIYLWKDEKGVTHATDNPQAKASTSQEVKLKTNSSSDPYQAERAKSIKAQLKSYDDAQDERRKQATKLADEAAQKAEDCNRARRGVALYSQQTRLATINEKGERQYISDQERAEKLTTLNAAVAESCKP